MDHPIFHSRGFFARVITSLPVVQRELVVRHSYRVDITARRIGVVLRLEPRYELKVLHFAAVRHDVSKFLGKFQSLFFDHRGNFSQIERARAEKHALVSALVVKKLWDKGEIPEDFAIVAPAIIIIAGHHWRYTESKQRYEALLKHPRLRRFADYCSTLGEFPLLGGRILKVADCFVSAMEKRHYPKPVLGMDDAYAEIASEARDQYDPEVVSALEKIIMEPRQPVGYSEG